MRVSQVNNYNLTKTSIKRNHNRTPNFRANLSGGGLFHPTAVKIALALLGATTFVTNFFSSSKNNNDKNDNNSSNSVLA